MTTRSDRRGRAGRGSAVRDCSFYSKHPYEAIIDTAARDGCDVVFMGSHGRRGMARMMLGSQTEKVLTHSKIPLLVSW